MSLELQQTIQALHDNYWTITRLEYSSLAPQTTILQAICKEGYYTISLQENAYTDKHECVMTIDNGPWYQCATSTQALIGPAFISVVNGMIRQVKKELEGKAPPLEYLSIE